MNHIILIGRLTKDPELRFTTTGKAVATFSIAVDRRFSKEKETDFFNIKVWNKIGESCANYLSKGRLVAVQGSLQNRTYETQTGEKKYFTEVVASEVEFLEWGDKNNNTSTSRSSSSPKGFNPDDINLDDFQAIDEDEDVPF